LGGLTACFTQSKGATVVAAFVAYLMWKARREGVPANEWLRKCLLLCGAAAALFVVANGYFIRAAGLRHWFFCIVTYPVFYYSVPAINNWRVVEYDFRWHPGLGRWISFPFVYATVPLVYIVFALDMRRRCKKDRDVPWDRLVLVALTGLALFLSIAASPSVKRLSTVSPPAMILLAWLLNRPGRTAGCLRALLGTLAVALAIAAAVYNQTRWRAYLDLPAGRTALLDPVQYEEYRWMLGHTHPGQYFFGVAPMYLPFHLLNPTAVEGFDPSEYTRPDQVAAGVRALKMHVVPLMILPLSELRPGRSPSDHLRPFRDYLHQNYQLIKTFRNADQVWEKIDAPGSIPNR
jgi:hypothetical protein